MTHENIMKILSVNLLPCFAVKFQIYFVLDIVHYLKALFFWSVLMQYMLFSSVTGNADMWCQKECRVYPNRKGFPFKRLWDTKNTFFLPDGILLSIGHFHNNVILLLNCQNPSGFCPVCKLGLLLFKPR